MYRYCGKEWSHEDIGKIQELLRREPKASRLGLSRLVCAAFDWRRPNGKLKEMSCRVAMLKMARDGLIELPAPRCERPSPYQLTRSPASDPEPEVICGLSDFADLKLEVVPRGPALRRWNELVGQLRTNATASGPCCWKASSIRRAFRAPATKPVTGFRLATRRAGANSTDMPPLACR